jgi:hypothetical protein
MTRLPLQPQRSNNSALGITQQEIAHARAALGVTAQLPAANNANVIVANPRRQLRDADRDRDRCDFARRLAASAFASRRWGRI